MAINLISFGYRNGEPGNVASFIDCRGLNNPHKYAKYRKLDGRDPLVQDFVRHDSWYAILENDALTEAVDGSTVAFGCYGGRHRSVAMVELVASKLLEQGFEVLITHRDL